MSQKLDDETKRLNTIMPVPLMRRIDVWRARQPDVPGVSEAIRRLIEMSLDAGKKKGGRHGRRL